MLTQMTICNSPEYSQYIKKYSIYFSTTSHVCQVVDYSISIGRLSELPALLYSCVLKKISIISISSGDGENFLVERVSTHFIFQFIKLNNHSDVTQRHEVDHPTLFMILNDQSIKKTQCGVIETRRVQRILFRAIFIAQHTTFHTTYNTPQPLLPRV